MKQRLKKERRKLFRRIILMMMGIWLIVSALFCAVRLDLEKTFIKQDEKSELQSFIRTLTDDSITYKKEITEDSLPPYVKSFYSTKSTQEIINSQLVFTNKTTGEIVLNTADTVAEEYTYSLNNSPFHYTALLHYGMIRYALTDTQFREIEQYLNQQEDGNYYELICTRLRRYKIFTIPLELKIVKVDGNHPEVLLDNHVKTYSLDINIEKYDEIYENYDEADRNIIPKGFLFDDERTKDYIKRLTNEDREKRNRLFQLDGFDYLYYTRETLTTFSNDQSNEVWTVEYAKKFNLIESCHADLVLGIAFFFSFFLMLAVFLFLMSWTTLKTELLLEQRRLDLTNALAHDVKTPLFVISGYGYTLKEDIDEKERDLYLQKIIEQTDEANSLVHRMLDFSKLDSYKITLHKTKFDLRELTEAVLQNYAVLSDNKTIVLTHSDDNTVNADKELIKTAVQNLTDNAVKYAFPDSEIRINLSGKTFSISNQTEPLTKDELKELQMPYMRKDKSRSQKGNGLGLSIVKSILELHDAPFDIKMKDTTLTCSFTLKTKKSRRSV